MVRKILTASRYMVESKLTSKAQTTIPAPVRAALSLREGDELLYEIDGGRVIVTKVKRKQDGEDPFSTFEEWNSKADRHAYGRL
jgi:antitoxin PrlF